MPADLLARAAIFEHTKNQQKEEERDAFLRRAPQKVIADPDA
jgi:hypothetical protein